jgi:hypothetical protein
MRIIAAGCTGSTPTLPHVGYLDNALSRAAGDH